MSYIDHTHPSAFDDVPLRDPPTTYQPTWTAVCGRCRGRGKWNIKLNAYGPGKHFQASCGVCHGWGYRDPSETCLHEWGNGENVGNCLTTYTCVHCGKKKTIDSSD